MSRRGENIYKRKDGRWEGRYMKGRREDGTIKYGYIYRQSYKEVRMALTMKKMQMQEQYPNQESYSGTCREWFQSWLLHEIQTKVKLSTYASYHYKCQTYILPAIGDIPLNQLTTKRLQELVDQWQRQFSMNTLQVLYRIVSKSLRTAVTQKYLLLNPCDGVMLPKKTVSPIRALSIAEQTALEAAAAADSQGLLVLLALHTGLRMGELAALQWQDIDFDAQLIRVTHTYQRLPLPYDTRKTQLVYTQAKTTASIRVVPFSSKVKQWLLEWQHQETTDFVFSRNKKPMEPRLITYHFQRIRKAAALTDIHFHQLRHTFATRCMEAKGDVAAISALLGHSSAKTTLDVYTDALLDQRRAVILAMEDE